MDISNLKLYKDAMFAKSFYLLGDSLNNCYNCSYCRLNGEQTEEKHFHILPSEINENFLNIPVSVNLFYGDPLLQIDNTINLLKRLEQVGHTGPVIIVTKGDYSKFPDIPFNLDLHVAFSCFGVNSKYDGSTMERFINNLECIKKRKNNYKYSIEFRPIIYNVNDSDEVLNEVINIASKYNLPIGYSGLQGKKESVEIWKKNNIDLKPYPGYNFGHKKIIDKEIINKFEQLAKDNNVNVFRKTSCLFSYVHNLDRDYNAHYYRPSEMNCNNCVMEEKCMSYKEHLNTNINLDNIIPFDYEIIEKEKHECILKSKGICEFPSVDCSNISGKLIKINDIITTSDVRVIKWLTGYTVDANFLESPYISKAWVKKKVK